MIFKQLLEDYLNKNNKTNKMYNDDYLNVDITFSSIITNVTNKLNDIVKHRNGKIIKPADVYLLENIMTVFGVLNCILSLSYFDVVACPSLISSKSLYKFKSSPDWDRTSLKRKMSIVARGNFFSTLQAFACFARKFRIATLLRPKYLTTYF